MQVSLKMLNQLFSNLMLTSENIAVAMRARGFTGPEDHKVFMGSQQHYSVLPNVIAVALLGGLVTGHINFA